MRAQIGLGALLISACISDPAYIGEGPAKGDGVNGDEGASDDGATGDEGIGPTGAGGGGTTTGGAPAGGTTTAGAGGVGARSGLPLQSGRCTVTYPGIKPPTPVTWDADARLFTVGPVSMRFDERGLLVEDWYDGGYHQDTEYDARGTIAAQTYSYGGQEYPQESWDQTNTYDNGLLARSSLVYRSGDKFQTDTFSYTDGLATLIEWNFEGPLGSARVFYRLTYENGRPVQLEMVQDGLITDFFRAWYDDAGRLVQTEWDAVPIGGVEIDGEIDFRENWTYDNEGRTIRFESDFGDLDGVPEEVYIFDPACADIAAYPRYLYAIPSWLFPYPSIGYWG